MNVTHDLTRQLNPVTVDLTYGAAYNPPSFEATFAIDRMHNAARAGYTNDITLLVTGNKEEQEEYVQGLLVLSVLIGCIFVTWALILLLLKCFGKRVGCASGSPRKPNAVNNEEYDIEVKKAERCLRINRFVFVLSGIGAFISISVFLSYGVQSLQKSIDSVSDALNGMIDITVTAENITELFMEAFNATNDATEDLEVRNFTWCPSLYDTPDDEMPDTILAIKDGVQTMTDYVSDLSTDTVDVLSNVQEDIHQVGESLETVDDNLESIEIAFVFALILSGFQLAVVVGMTLGVILAWCNSLPSLFRWTQSYIFLPIFTVSILLSIALSSAFVVGSLAGSDFCYPTPDNTVVSILEDFKTKLGSDMFNVIVYYIYGCPEELNTMKLSNYTELVIDALGAAHNLTYTLANADASEITDFCGKNASVIVGAADKVHNALHYLAESVSLTQQLFYCETINSLYAYLAYDAVCLYGVDSLYGVYISQLMIAIFCMIMVTVRVSWQDIDKAYAVQME